MCVAHSRNPLFGLRKSFAAGEIIGTQYLFFGEGENNVGVCFFGAVYFCFGAVFSRKAAKTPFEVAI